MIGPIIDFLGGDLGLGSTVSSIIAPAIEGGAVNAGISALTGKSPLTGALTGALTGGALGGLTGPVADTLGISPGMAGALVGGAVNAAGSALTGGSPLTGALTGALGGYAYGSGPGSVAVDPSTGAAATGVGSYGAGMPTGGPAAAGNSTMMTADPTGSGSSGSATSNVGSEAGVYGGGGGSSGGSSDSSGGGGGGTGKTGGISNTALALGALAALGSANAKPQIGTWPTPGPNSVQQGPYFNTPLNPSFPGRTAVNPFASGTGPQATAPGQPPNYWYYGSEPQTYFTGNSLGNYGGFAHGGALNQAANEFSTRHGHNYVQGDGDGQSDEVPAALSDGEFVVDATTVSRLGNGSNRKGAEKLNQMREAVAHAAGSDRVVQKKVKKSPLDYMAGRAA